MNKRNLIEQAFDKLVCTDVDQRWINYTKKYPGVTITDNNIKYKNGKIIKDE
tara:strand:+ start:60 stop:215 length:156 start_codon:yes stop_codon:yes gene_type:complete